MADTGHPARAQKPVQIPSDIRVKADGIGVPEQAKHGHIGKAPGEGGGMVQGDR